MRSSVVSSPATLATCGAGVASASRACLFLLATGSAAAASDSSSPLPTDAYFEEYGSLYDHIGMLQDNERMRAYHDAIKLNAERHFKGKVVLDVGTGTGVLSIWAAQAGAKRVYAVEATAKVAADARTLVAANGFADTITVLAGKMEELELPEKVDVLLSEWMGYFLLREAMVNSVLDARDRWLKPSGVMYPSHARLLMSSMEESGFAAARQRDLDDAMEGWAGLEQGLKAQYGVDYGALRSAYLDENQDYFFRNAWQGAVASHATIGEGQVLLDVDMKFTKKSDLFGWSKTIFLPEASPTAAVHLLCGWFDVRFCAADDGGDGSAAPSEAWEGGPEGACVELSTAPTKAYTHWAHTTFVLDPPMRTPALNVGLTLSRKSQHDLNVTIAYEADAVPGATGGDGKQSVEASYFVTADFRSGKRSDEDADALDMDVDD